MVSKTINVSGIFFRIFLCVVILIVPLRVISASVYPNFFISYDYNNNGVIIKFW